MFEVIHKRDLYGNLYPYGIRNRDGYVLFFVKPARFSGQNQRYADELAASKNRAEVIVSALNQESEEDG